MDVLEKLKEYIRISYDPEENGGVWWESGNFDDAWECGRINARTWTLYEIGALIGMDLERPKEIDFDY